MTCAKCRKLKGSLFATHVYNAHSREVMTTFGDGNEQLVINGPFFIDVFKAIRRQALQSSGRKALDTLSSTATSKRVIP